MVPVIRMKVVKADSQTLSPGHPGRVPIQRPYYSGRPAETTPCDQRLGSLTLTTFWIIRWSQREREKLALQSLPISRDGVVRVWIINPDLLTQSIIEREALELGAAKSHCPSSGSRRGSTRPSTSIRRLAWKRCCHPENIGGLWDGRRMRVLSCVCSTSFSTRPNDKSSACGFVSPRVDMNVPVDALIARRARSFEQLWLVCGECR